MTRSFPQPHDSTRKNGLLTSVCVLEKRTARNSFSRAAPGLNNRTVEERDVSLTLHTPGVRPAQVTPKIDGISARDEFLRREAERGSQMLLRAMIRELQAMGRLA